MKNRKMLKIVKAIGQWALLTKSSKLFEIFGYCSIMMENVFSNLSIFLLQTNDILIYVYLFFCYRQIMQKQKL